jgi:hypothetical protein
MILSVTYVHHRQNPLESIWNFWTTVWPDELDVILSFDVEIHCLFGSGVNLVIPIEDSAALYECHAERSNFHPQ